MTTSFPIRLAALVLALAIAATACSSGDPSTSDGPLYTPTQPAPAPTEPAADEPGPTAEPDTEIEGPYDAAVAALVPEGSPGAIVRIDLGGTTLLETAVGEVEIGSGPPLTPQHPFRIASTTKPVTAVTVLRLHEQGRLDIDDPIADYLPADLVAALHVLDGVSRGGEITIRHLLAHTSGLADRPFDTPFVDVVGEDPGRVWTPRELVEYTIANAEPRFAPGDGFHYSDDGYVLLGMIIESATGQPLHEVYRQEVLDRLGMDDTYLEGHEDPRGLELSHPYLRGFDGAEVHPSTDWGGGGLVSTVGDLARFGAALRNGTLFDQPETHQEMLRDTGSGYGLGIYVSPLGNGLTALGHDGFWGSDLLVVPEIDLVVAATMNQFVEEDVRQEFFLGLFGLVDQVLTDQEPSRPEDIQHVEVDGRTTAYVSAGAGTPTVVFEAGFGDGMEAWEAVAAPATAFANVFAYDRAGYGDSDLADGPRDGRQIVEDLRSVLAASGHEPPYVLVGHSMGGMYMELFARTHPDEVAGLVLVDATPAGYFERCGAVLGTSCEPPFDPDQMPEPFRSEARSIPTTEEQVLAAAPLGPIPAVVLVSPRSDGVPDRDAIWVDAQREQAAALDATFVLAEDSGHYIQNDQPDLVLDAIESLVSATS